MYTILKKMITNNTETKERLQNKIDMFFAKNRITEEQYAELTELNQSRG